MDQEMKGEKTQITTWVRVGITTKKQKDPYINELSVQLRKLGEMQA